MTDALINVVVTVVMMIRKPLPGINIRWRSIKGKLYGYQCIRAYRDKNTGMVHKIERYLGAKEPSRAVPIMETLGTDERARVVAAWQDGADISEIVTMVRALTGDYIGQATAYNFFRDNQIPRGHDVEVAEIRRAAQAKVRADKSS